MQGSEIELLNVTHEEKIEELQTKAQTENAALKEEISIKQ